MAMYGKPVNEDDVQKLARILILVRAHLYGLEQSPFPLIQRRDPYD
jgi:hypothetical protein